jgi:hypothetical protein
LCYIVIEILPHLSAALNIVLTLYPGEFDRFTFLGIFKSSLYLFLTDETQPSARSLMGFDSNTLFKRL